jgi:hypothetical protein
MTVANHIATIQQHRRVSSQAELMALILTKPLQGPRLPSAELGDFHIRKRWQNG